MSPDMSMTPAPVTPAIPGHTPHSQAEDHTSPPAENAATIRCSLSPAISATRSRATVRPTAHNPITTAHLLPPSPEESASRDWTLRPSGPGPPSLSPPTLLQRHPRGADAPSRCRPDQDDLTRSADREAHPMPAHNRQGWRHPIAPQAIRPPITLRYRPSVRLTDPPEPPDARSVGRRPGRPSVQIDRYGSVVG